MLRHAIALLALTIAGFSAIPRAVMAQSALLAQEGCETSIGAFAGDRAGDPPFGYRFTAGDFRDDPGAGRWIRFLTEPVVTSIAPDGPVEGLLRVGDGIEAVDGALITTEEGSRRFASLGGSGGETSTVVVRRDGRSLTVQIPACPARALALPDVAASDTAGTTPPPPTSSAAASGMRLRCLECGYDEHEGWRFSTPPVVTEVREGSPAAVAGLRPGDEIVSIDGIALGTAEGDRRFSRLGPGDRASWTVRRGVRTLEIAWSLDE